MNIIHIEDFFHPDAGYQINILSKYFVKQGHDVTIITSEMKKIPEFLTDFFGRNNIEQADKNYTNKTGVNIVRLPLKAFISGRAVYQSNIFRKVNELKPDILYVHSNDTLIAIRYLLRLKKLNYPLVMDCHMLEMASKNPFNKEFRMFYKMLITPIIKKNNIKVIRIEDDNYVEKCLGIPLTQCPWISVGSDTILFHPDNDTRQSFRKQNNISSDDFVVVYTGKLDTSKGGKLLAEAFKNKLINSKNKNVVLVVVGNASGEYGKEVDEIFNKSENVVLRFPTQKYIDLPQFYQAADLSVFPKQCSLSFYDAQACGLPVVSEDNNINIDRLQYNNGYNFRSGNIEDFRTKITQCIDMDSYKLTKMGIDAYNFVKENYDYEDIAKQYTDILVDEYNKFHGR